MKKTNKAAPIIGKISRVTAKTSLPSPVVKKVSYPGVYVEEVSSGARSIPEIETSIVAFIGRAASGPVNDPIIITDFAGFERAFGGLQVESRLGYAVRDFFLNGGRKAIIVRIGDEDTSLTSVDFIGLGKQANKEGLYALDRVDLFNLLVIPPYTGTGDVDTSVLSEAAIYCERRRAFLIVDAPTSWTTTAAARSGISSLGTSSKNAAVYFPRILQPDPLQNTALTTFAPGGAIAGIYARTDSNRGVWKAPAGTGATLTGVSGFTIPVSDHENGQLNSVGINCLRMQPSLGPVIWGSRTLQGNYVYASEWKYIPVRRTALFIEESLI